MAKGKKHETGKKNGVVLLIEDEQDTADIIRLHLEKSGLSIVHARDGRHAVSIMEDIVPPRAILLDLVVPYLNGFELLKAIRAKPGWEQVPVMVVSGDSDKGDIERMLAEGASDYVVKSCGVGVIHHRLKQMLEQTSSGQVKDEALAANSQL
ncbi:MAG: response regulator [Nitrospiraceae bacterium]|jgi:DNA-binding response OmpR family regulator